MRLIAFADTHLGAARYSKMTKDGQNVRQHDVQVAFCRMMDGVIAAQPDVVVVGGDLFETPNPDNRTITVAMQEFGRPTRTLPSCAVVIVAGNHDTNLTAIPGHVFGILGTLPLCVVANGIVRIDADAGVSISCVPDTPVAKHEIREMKERGITIGRLGNEDAKYNVLLMHGEVEGMLPKAMHLPATAHRSEIERPLEEIAPDAWNYVALGHWHVYREMAPRTFYSGSLEYTSTDPWSELRQERALGIAGKGFVEHDLATGAHTFHPLAVDRQHIDLPEFSADGLSSTEVNAAIAERVGSVSIDNQVVRLVVTDVPKGLLRDLDHTALRKYKMRALHFNLVTRAPAPATHVSTVNTPSARYRADSFLSRITQKIVDVIPIDDRRDALTIASQVLEQVKLDGEPEINLVKLLDASLAAQAVTPTEAAAA